MSDGPTADSLIAANARFYRTFETLDYPAMEALWEQSDRVFCVHPGWVALRGARPVLESWRRIIANTAAMHFDLTLVDAHVEGNLGIVTVYEHIFTEANRERHTSAAVSTNLFAFDAAAGDWKIFHHHAAHAPLPDDGEQGPLN